MTSLDAPAPIKAPDIAPVPGASVQKPQPRPVATAPEAAKPAASATQPPPPVMVKSASQIACEKKKGSFVSLGRSGVMTCQLPTRDGGKLCHRESDCDGVCLARSNTCAPVKPLLGCQSILQDDGRQVELCID